MLKNCEEPITRLQTKQLYKLIVHNLNVHVLLNQIQVACYIQ